MIDDDQIVAHSYAQRKVTSCRTLLVFISFSFVLYHVHRAVNVGF